MTTLTSKQHEDAKCLAYFLAINRGGGDLPPYEKTLADGDFIEAAGHVVLFESSPRTIGSREYPVALQKYPKLEAKNNAAAEEFERICKDLTDEEYWSLLGHVWVFAPKEFGKFDPVYSARFKKLFSSKRKGRDKLMTPNERAAFISLPTSFVVYRGCKPKTNEGGLSWSLTIKTGVWFGYKYYSYNSIVLTGLCETPNVIAHFLYDNEYEIITDGGLVKLTKTEKLEDLRHLL